MLLIACAFNVEDVAVLQKGGSGVQQQFQPRQTDDAMASLLEEEVVLGKWGDGGADGGTILTNHERGRGKVGVYQRMRVKSPKPHTVRVKHSMVM